MLQSMKFGKSVDLLSRLRQFDRVTKIDLHEILLMDRF